MDPKKITGLIIGVCLITVIVCVPVHLFAGENKSIKHEAGYYYMIKKGDTLWDLSERFFDSAWEWPDLWKENTQISNPHLIYPGERIRLFRQVSKESILERKEKEPVRIEPPIVEPEKDPPYYFYSMIDMTGFIKKETIKPAGTIFKVKNVKTMISIGDIVFIRAAQDISMMPGSRYYIYRLYDPTRDKMTKKYLGSQHYISGIVEIEKQETGFYTGRVIQSFRSIHLKDHLMPYNKRSKKVILTEASTNISGKIIGSEERTAMIGQDMVVFINKGENDGVKTGQCYNVFYQDQGKIKADDKVELLFPPVDFAVLLVIGIEKYASTALVLHSEKSIDPGAEFHSMKYSLEELSGEQTGLGWLNRNSR